MITAHEKICEVLSEASIGFVFGIPGGSAMRIFDSLSGHADRVRPILVRHEQSASVMADVYGRLTGKPGVVLGQGAFIGTNAVFGTLEAHLAGSPMVVLADTTEGGDFSLNPRNASGWGSYGAFDLRNLLDGITKFSVLAATPKEAVLGLQMAIKHAVTGRPGPTAVVMRQGAIAGELDPEKPPRVHPTGRWLRESPTLASPEDLVSAIELLGTAQRPVIIAGNGVHAAKAYGELAAMAELLGSPVATTYNGKSAFRENHPLALGMMGRYGQPVANSVVGEADTILVVGSRLAPNDTNSELLIDADRQKLIQIDIEPRNAGWSYPVEVALVGDAKAVLKQMLQMGGEGLRTRDPRAAQRLEERKRAEKFFESPALHSGAVPIMPQRLVGDLNEELDPEAIVTLDAGSNRVWMAHYFQTKAPGTLFVPGGLAGMGWGPPAAVGAKLVHPDRPVVSVSGDGGFSMSVHVIATAVQYNLPVVFVVMNNSALSMIATGDLGGDSPAAFNDTDFASIAHGFGAEGLRVRNPGDIRDAVSEALRKGRPTVIDVITDGSEGLKSISSGATVG